MKLRICYSALTSFMVASIVIAQGPPGGGGPGGLFRMMGPENSQLAIVSLAEVQTELAISAEQKKQLDELLTANQTAVQEAMASIDFQAMMALEPTHSRAVKRRSERRSAACWPSSISRRSNPCRS